ncbi:DUF4144 domain-containing protein [Pseudoalteromonas shioyasakiensis]|uniref:DUF4144 domain-containing protein n=1 Tax=Pseudoalteromonas shioyasakiensis TaxID=1190813 RepID=UPI002117E529|nr:DUF4144 domain-containing protein [Pseudoalteromonas shioyasakiensis]MCQ8879549.1 DUF4144 domain-containing protein [Pseudoalteromonas shioyasakiensis]
MERTYPIIIIYNGELDLIEQACDIDSALYGFNQQQKDEIIMLDKVHGYQTLSGVQTPPLNAKELAYLVKDYLAKEGQCCLGKIDSLTPAQAFTLLAID